MRVCDVCEMTSRFELREGEGLTVIVVRFRHKFLFKLCVCASVAR